MKLSILLILFGLVLCVICSFLPFCLKRSREQTVWGINNVIFLPYASICCSCGKVNCKLLPGYKRTEYHKNKKSENWHFGTLIYERTQKPHFVQFTTLKHRHQILGSEMCIKFIILKKISKSVHKTCMLICSVITS